jgi:tetratricopeptide (TPR) repeat protein
MFKRLFRITLPLALLLSAVFAVSSAWSKPPDLPIDVKETCTSQCPSTCPQEHATIFNNSGVQECGAAVGGCCNVPNWQGSCQQRIMDVETYKALSAQNFYEIARQCEQNGDFAMASNCYEEATRTAPESEYGQLASLKLTAIAVANAKNRGFRGGVETEEEPPLVEQESTSEQLQQAHRVQQAHTMLLMGIRFQRNGDLDNAYRCFQDAFGICPACEHGQSALDHMRLIERSKSGDTRREGGVEEQEPPSDRRPPLTREELIHRDQAEAVFNLGERCRRIGNIEAAYGLYQETHLIFPECFYGMRAIQRMAEIETAK